MTSSPAPPSPSTGTRAASAVGGLLLILLSAVFVMMCGPNDHLPGALLGGLGATIIGWRRRSRRIALLGLAGGVLGALVGAGIDHVVHETCADWWTTIGAGVTGGAGMGLLGVTFGRRAPSPPAEPA